jgi:hypothetical protein
LKDSPKFIQTGIFGMKTCHLATLLLAGEKLLQLAASVWKVETYI